MIVRSAPVSLVRGGGPAASASLVRGGGGGRRAITTIVRSAARRAAESMDISLPSGRRIRDALRAPPPASLAHLSRSGADSLLSTALPFKSDAELRAASVNASGHLRVGLLFEELDAFAGAVAYTYCDAADVPGLPTLVTASMDRVDLLRYPLRAETDLVLRGGVTATGASSMNIDVDLLDAADGAPVMQASLTFVARGRGYAAVPVPVLRPVGAAQEARAAAGRASMAARRAARAASLLVTPPTPDELAQVHKLFTERERAGVGAGAGGGAGASAPPARFPSETVVTTTDITMPTDSNVHGKVFGGWLLRRAFEAAFAAGWRFTGASPRFLALDDVTFLAPVEVGALLRLEARVAYSLGAPHRTYVVVVTAAMATPGRALAGGDGRDSMATNEFSFTFHTGDDPGTVLPRVFPHSYADAMGWIAASRRANVGRALAEARRAGGGPRARFTDEDEAEAARARARNGSVAAA